MAGAPDLEAIVRRAWGATLALDAIDPALSWEEAGADSLLSLRLLLQLEKTLGRKLSFDIIDPDMTIPELAGRLALGGLPAPAADEVAPAPTLFLVPGMFGDEPILADFRRWFGACLRFEIVELPAIDAPAAIHASMARTGETIAREIARRQPRGALMIAGYSFGGGAAYEAARSLVDTGREVAFLGLLDATLRSPEGRSAQAWTDPPRDLARAVVHLLAQSDVTRGAMLAATRRFGPDALIAMRRRLLRGMRIRAVTRWRPRRLPVPILLVACEETERAIATNWARLLPGAATVETPGGHLDLFRPAAMARLGPAMLTAMGTVA